MKAVMQNVSPSQQQDRTGNLLIHPCTGFAPKTRSVVQWIAALPPSPQHPCGRQEHDMSDPMRRHAAGGRKMEKKKKQDRAPVQDGVDGLDGWDWLGDSISLAGCSVR